MKLQELKYPSDDELLVFLDVFRMLCVQNRDLNKISLIDSTS